MITRNTFIEPRPHVMKRATDIRKYERPVFPFPNARTALLSVLKSLDLSRGDKILLPSYIGWSKNEGSGVFDPIASLNLDCVFYRLTCDLQIDLHDLELKMRSTRARVLLIIHYFGFPDQHVADVIQLARTNQLFVVEDEAHALLSDWVGGVCGRMGNAAIMSLHKMLPVSSGGLLLLNTPHDNSINQTVENCLLRTPLEYDLLDYDFFSIASKRRYNAEHLLQLLQPLQGRIKPLFTLIPDGVVPQTLPTLVPRNIRDDLYHKMNEMGFGVVSLYHTLISSIDKILFADSYWVSKQIFNLPVHQDATSQALEAMVEQLDQLTKGQYIDE